MAITRLTDIITVFDSKWTYGDVMFGYDGEVNQDHDTQYPLMLVNPPESIIPLIYDGREEYAFEVNFYNLYSQAAQSVVTLQKRWDNLQDLSNEWLDMVLKNYQDTTVEAYLNDESVEIERIKDSKNDKLVQIKLTFTMSAFTKCFRPVSNYPTDFADLAVWLRADSGVTFDIPTKRVSVWADKSGQSNSMAQVTTSNQPLRYGYGGGNDKAYFAFDGTNDNLVSDNNFTTSADKKYFTIFEVSKINAAENAVFGYYDLDNSGRNIEMGTTATGGYGVSVSDGTTILAVNAPSTSVDLGEYHIGVLRMQNVQVLLDYKSATHNLSAVIDHNIAFTPATNFMGKKFRVGCTQTTDGLLPPAAINTRYLDGDIQELITYNRTLSDDETNEIIGYLNLKYKIY